MAGAGVVERDVEASSELSISEMVPPQHKCRISETFEELRREGRVAFIPFLTAGDPNLETTAKALRLLSDCGANVIELGIPTLHAVADGSTIKAADTRAINGGANLDSILGMMRDTLPDLKAPVMVFSYYEDLFLRGPERFLMEVKEAGASGILVPDLSFEEIKWLSGLAKAVGLQLVLLKTPHESAEHVVTIVKETEGFLYLVCREGVTGAQNTIDSHVESLIKAVKEVTNKPVAVGFGISSPEQAAQIAKWGGDGVIIGSAVVQRLGESGTPEQGLKEVEEFVRKIKAAIP